LSEGEERGAAVAWLEPVRESFRSRRGLETKRQEF
jgi:hypothetical protein